MDKQRNTVQRQIVLDALLKLNTHPAIDEIYAEIHQAHPSISKTTIYRNLRQLAENGVIRQVSLPDGLERYDGTMAQHHHFRCRNCGVIFDVDVDAPTGMDEAVRRKYGFRVDAHDIAFQGICSKCGGTRK